MHHNNLYFTSLLFLVLCGMLTLTGAFADNITIEYAPGELIVWFDTQAELSAQAMEQIYTTAHAKVGAQQIKTLSALGHPGIQLVQIPAGHSVEQAAQAYLSIGGVKYAEPNYIVKVQKRPDDPDYGFLWGMNAIMAPSAWEFTTGSKEVIVAVVDSGVDYTHKDLKENMWTNPGEIPNNGIDDDENGFIDDYYGWNFADNNADPMDRNDHGTHVAGTIGAVGNNGVGVAGVNWDVSIMAVKGLGEDGSGYTFDLIASVIYASNMGADIINNSWGGGSPSRALTEAVRMSPALIVFAAGNDGTNLDIEPKNTTINAPNVLIVAASNAIGNPAPFTNYGKSTVHVAAPGVSIYSTTPNNNYAFYQGTSMAAPMVAGLAALMKAANPELTASEIKNIIMETTTPTPQWSEMVIAGGIINAANAVSKVYKQDLAASFTIDVLQGYAPLQVQVTDTSKGDPIAWTWDFGDGTPPKSGSTATHTYTSAAIRSITLYISDGEKNSATTQTVTVKPKASITGAPLSGSAPLVVTFTISNTGGPGSGYIKLGNGDVIRISQITGQPQTFTYTYEDPGVYTIGYFFERPNGLSDYVQQIDYITVR